MSAVFYRGLLRLRIIQAAPLIRNLAATASAVVSPSERSSSSAFTVSFLTSSCGLAPAQAASIARSLRLSEETRHKPESVLALLQSQGFSEAQIAELVCRSPRVLLSRVELKLGPKVQYLNHMGFSSDMIARDPRVLLRSLERHIRPCFEFLRCFIGSAKDFRTLFRRHRWCLDFDMKTTMIPNVALLLEMGVAAPAISRLIVTHPRSLMKNRERFLEIIKIVQDWGLTPEKNLFLHAIRAIAGLGKSTLATRLELFKRLGWSDDDIISAFQRGPLFILVSEQKLLCMTSFARKLGLTPSDISRQPKLLMYGFEKRILPRYAVWQVLLAKGLIKQNNKLVSMFTTSEKPFLDRFVMRHLDKVPELLDVYLGKIKVEELGLCGKESRCQKDS
ncbi:unnamed protein product [Spirodela intermedia]|uniref:Uncharacterized protein n=2 Tax=Spirodela intermedia TaxID=51605 RepID=A0A7I8JXE8_SPIIN|nr:unnamed protein product [Spirodela intermedia]CAA6653988.1 unnamed protein product [Spirodela intermedia]CAA7388427.1 unnamed protein product [Spirodela intermedia]